MERMTQAERTQQWEREQSRKRWFALWALASVTAMLSGYALATESSGYKGLGFCLLVVGIPGCYALVKKCVKVAKEKNARYQKKREYMKSRNLN